ncbi:hypothetical protein [Streptomyces sp. NPDC051994]|uniref:hypothetical protein n=1 Tax=unclassified Streptomyces TaxID=2593676 RepID=UPI00341EB01D
MAEHDADREPQPIDEEAAWAAIVAGYGEEPADPPGARPFRSVEDLALIEDEPEAAESPDPEPKPKPDADPDKDQERPALGSSVVFAPGVGGPRDFQPSEASDDDADGSDEGHFVPPEPPPLPEADVTAKFAWLGVLGGPLLLLLAAIFGWDMTWWLTFLGVGGFLGGIATLFARMQHDEDDDDPGRGAVV